MDQPAREHPRVIPPPTGVPAMRPSSRASLRLVAGGCEPRFVDVVGTFFRLRELAAWTELRSLVADDARLESVEAAGVAGADATIEAMRFSAAGAGSVVEAYELESLGDEAVLICASMDSDDGADTDGSVRSLVTGRAGLIWRARIVPSRSDAEAMLGAHGLTLGL